MKKPTTGAPRTTKPRRSKPAPAGEDRIDEKDIDDLTKLFAAQAREYNAKTNKPIIFTRAETNLLVRYCTHLSSSLSVSAKAASRKHLDSGDLMDSVSTTMLAVDFALFTVVLDKLVESEE